MFEAKRLKAGALFHLSGKIVGNFFALACAFILVRYLSQVDYAAYIGVSGLAGLAALISSLGLDRAVAKYPPALFERAGSGAAVKFLWRALVARMLSVCVLLVIAATVFFVAGLDKGWLQREIVQLAVVFYALCYTLNEHLRISMYALVEQRVVALAISVQWLVRLVMISWVAFFSGILSFGDAAVVLLAGELVAIIVMLARLLLMGAPRSGDGADQPVALEVARFSLPNYFGQLASLPAQSSTLRIAAASLLPAESAAVFGFFLALIERVRPYLPLQLLENLIEVKANQIAAQGPDSGAFKASSMVSLIAKFNFVILFFASLFMLVFGNEVVALLAGPKYSDGAMIVVLLLVYTAFCSLVLALQILCNAASQASLILKSNLVSIVVCLACLALLGLPTNPFALVALSTLFQAASVVVMAWACRGKALPTALMPDWCLLLAAYLVALGMAVAAAIYVSLAGVLLIALLATGLYIYGAKSGWLYSSSEIDVARIVVAGSDKAGRLLRAFGVRC